LSTVALDALALSEIRYAVREGRRVSGETIMALLDEITRLRELVDGALYPMHFCIGDSAATMRMVCGRPISDACWTRNPRLVTCERCEREIEGGGETFLTSKVISVM